MNECATLEDQEILRSLRQAYAPDGGDVREHNSTTDSLGFGLIHYALVRNLRPDFVLAIGSRYGFVPACLALALKANRTGRLHFVDANYNDQTDQFCVAYGGTGHWCKPTQEVFSAFSLDEWIDVFVERTDSFFSRTTTKYGYVYIDGNHSYEGVRYDCEQALKHLLPQGIITFHDALVDETFVRRMTKPADFGVKAYLAEHFPRAVIVNQWPGLAIVQSHVENGQTDPEIQHNRLQYADEANPDSAGRACLLRTATESSQRLGELEAKVQEVTREHTELRKLFAEQNNQVRDLTQKLENLNARYLAVEENIARLLKERQQLEDYSNLITRIHNVVYRELPSRAIVLIVSKGDEQLIGLGTRQGLHFPQTNGGVYAGHYPADSTEAINHLKELRRRGAQYLLFPRTSLWWLDCYPEFRSYLECHHRLIVNQPEICLVYDLRRLSRKR